MQGLAHPDLDSVIQGMITTPQCPHVPHFAPGKIKEVIAFALAHKWMLELSGEKTENASMKVLISLALPGIGPIVIYVQTLVQTLLANWIRRMYCKYIVCKYVYTFNLYYRPFSVAFVFMRASRV